MRVKLRYPDDSDAGYVEFNGVKSVVYDERGNLILEVEGKFPDIRTEDYGWIDKVLSRGIRDGRKRFILFVAGRYLVNVKGLDVEDAVKVLREFYSKDGGTVYEAWIRSVLRGVKSKGLKPWSLTRIRENFKDLYDEIRRVIGEEA